MIATLAVEVPQYTRLFSVKGEQILDNIYSNFSSLVYMFALLEGSYSSHLTMAVDWIDNNRGEWIKNTVLSGFLVLGDH